MAVTFDRRWPVRDGVAAVFDDGTVGRGAFRRSLSHRSPTVVARNVEVDAVLEVNDAGIRVSTAEWFEEVRIVGRVLDTRRGVVAEIAIDQVELISAGPSLAELEEAQRRRRAGVAGVDYDGP